MELKDQKRRLRQKDLIAMLFILFSEEYDRSEADSITDITIPMSAVRDYIRLKTGIAYSNDAWITTQVHKYEEELGIELFRKIQEGQNSMLGLCRDISTYEQKRHLYITQKIRTANGVFDLIKNSLEEHFPGRPVSILLEAGSTVTRVAEIIAQNLPSMPVSWDIFTNNLGVIECLGKTAPAFSKVTLSVPSGRFNPATNLILGSDLGSFSSREFDWIIQGTSFLSGRKLFVERTDEAWLKSRILHECRGRKVLVLTGHEATAHPKAGVESFGLVDDYDYIIHPALPQESAAARRLGAELSGKGVPVLSIMIRNWSYQIMVPVR
jgi:DeoR/GlpR family transcriptional regulator of sugar metabolism